uniref:Uncharacterized protein n=1 Tax=Arundo donax TaxID=35708 RepID=A0A0A9DQY7_ARUDO
MRYVVFGEETLPYFSSSRRQVGLEEVLLPWFGFSPFRVVGQNAGDSGLSSWVTGFAGGGRPSYSQACEDDGQYSLVERFFCFLPKKQRHFVKPVEIDFIPISTLLHWAGSLRRSGG